MLEVHDGDTISSLACELEAKSYAINSAFPKATVKGKELSYDSLFSKVNLKSTYKFGKQCTRLSSLNLVLIPF